MAYQRTQDNTKADQNTKLLADSLDAAVNGAISSYKDQVTVADNEAESNFQALVAAGNMSLTDQLSYRKSQLSNTQDSATRANIRTQVATLNAQITQKGFSDSYTVQLQQNAAGIESIQSVISWLQGQLATTTDQSIKDKINSELVTQNGNLFNATQKALGDQTTYAKNSGNMSVIDNQINALASAKGKALLGGDTESAANLDLQIQSLQQFVAEQNIATTMQHLATATITGSSSAADLLNAYGAQISGADSTTPVTVNGVTYASAQAYFTYARDSYVADTGAAGLFSRLANETTDSVNVKASNNTLSSSDLAAINSQFAQLASNPILAPFSAQLATAKQTALQAAADALSTKIENSFDQSLDLNTALHALDQISSQGANVDKTTQSILNSAAQTQSQAVQSIMSAANDLVSANPGMSFSTAVSKAVASGAGAIVPNNELLSKTPAAIAAEQLSKDANGTATNPTSTTIAPSATPGTPGATPTATPTATPSQPAKSYTIKSGDTLSAIAAANGTTVAALAAANHIANPNVIQAGATITIPSAVPTSAPAPYTPSPSSVSTGIDYTLHPGESIDQYSTRIAQARLAANPPAPVATPTATPSYGAGVSNVVKGTNGSYIFDYQGQHYNSTVNTLPQDYLVKIGVASSSDFSSQSSTPSPAVSTSAPAPTAQTPTPAPKAPTTSPTQTPTPTPSPTPSPSSSAPSVIRSSNVYGPPDGLTQTKTGGGGTGYTDKSGNLYVQSSPGIYTLNNSLK